MAPQSSSYVNEAHVQEVLASSPHWVPGVPERSLSVRELYWPLPPPTGARADARARSTTPTPLKPASSGGKASRPPTSRKCWGSPAPPCIATSPRTAQPRTCGAAAPAQRRSSRPSPDGRRPKGRPPPTICETLGKPVARLPRRHVGGMRQAHRQHEPPAVAGLGVTARTPCGLAIRVGSTRSRGTSSRATARRRRA